MGLNKVGWWFQCKLQQQKTGQAARVARENKNQNTTQQNIRQLQYSQYHMGASVGVIGVVTIIDGGPVAGG